MPASDAYQAITSTTLTLRGGRGAPIVNAAGNEFTGLHYPDQKLYDDKAICQEAKKYGVGCGDVATDIRRGEYVSINVGAIAADGKHSSYSNTGAGLWVVAPGGEWGYDSTRFPTAIAAPWTAPAITTTNRTGCIHTSYPSQGLPGTVNALDSKGAHNFATDCQHTALMNGTSAATPNVTAVVALMLEANPSLSVRDIKYILAKTARKTDASFAGVSATDIVAGTRIVLEQGWTTNAAGWSFSNRYGFGSVDAAAAVAMAKSYATYLPPVQTSSHSFRLASPVLVPAQSPTGRSMVIPVAASFGTVESAVVFLNIESTPVLACNQIELRSPSGTKSILLHYGKGFQNPSVQNSRIISNAFYGEPVNGNWTLTFFDYCPASTTSTRLATTAAQTLAIVGH